MNVALYIARRYLFSKKSSNAVNIISWISVFSIAIATFALVTVLSAFNGLQELVESLYEGFEPDVKITAAKGKWINSKEINIEDILSIEGVESTHKVLEELTLARYGKQQSPCTMKGVEAEFIQASGLDQNIFNGSANLKINNQPTALVGYGLASVLSVYVNNPMQSLKLYAPKLTSKTIINPDQAFHTKSISPAGIFMINPDIDNKFLIVPLHFAQKLLNKKESITGIEIKVTDGYEKDIKEKLIETLGDKYVVKTRFELNDIIYQTNQSEKVVTFFILTFILVIAAFNVISSLTMILLEKEKDIKTMRFLGFDLGRIRRIFIAEGMFINIIGISIGMISGWLLCLGQIHYGLVSLEGGIVDYYPVKIVLQDFLLILFTALTIGYIASYFPSRILIKEDVYGGGSDDA